MRKYQQLLDSKCFIRLAALLCLLVPLTMTAAYAQGGAPPPAPTPTVPVPSLTVNVGQTSPVVFTSVTFTTAGTLGNIAVVTQGALNKDFNAAPGGTCTPGQIYAVGQSCIEYYTFSPLAAGERMGAIVATDGSGNVLGTRYLTGVGIGPMGLFTNAVPTTTIGGLNAARGMSMDGNGNIYWANTNQSTGYLEELPHNSNTVVQLGGAINFSCGSHSAGATAVDGAGNVYLAAGCGAIYQYENGSLLYVTAVPSLDDNLEVDGQGNLYTSGFSNGNVGAIYRVSVQTHNLVTLLAGNLGHRFVSMGIDSNGDLFPADYYTNTLFEIPAGQSALQTLFSGNGLSNPDAVALDPAGNIYVCNLSGPDQVVRYAAGTWQATPLPAVGTVGIFLDNSGNLITLTSSNTLQVFIRTPPSVSFPSTAYGSTASAPLMEFENDGNAGLNVSAYAATASFGTNGAGNTCQAGTLNAGATCMIGASFTPVSTGALSGTLTLTDNNLNQINAQQSVGLSGSATQATLTVTASSESMTYGNAPPVVAPNYSGFVNGDSEGSLTSLPVCSTAATAASNVGVYGTSCAGGADPNYTFNYATGTMTVLPATPAISFSLASPVIVNATAGLNATASNGAAVSYSISGGTANINGGTLTFSNAGQVTVVASVAASTNYTAASAAQTVTVNPEPIAYAAPETSVGQSSAVQTAWVNIATAGTPASISVVTSGATGKDFNPPSPMTISGLDCSAGMAYSVGQACAVRYVFSPASPGEREGGVVLKNSSGVVLGSSYLGGVGDAPLGLFSSPTATWSVSDPNLVNLPRGISVDGNGNVYFANTNGAQGLNEIPSGGGSVIQVIATSVGTGATAVDGEGNVYLADADQQAIFELVNGHLVTIVSGFAPDDNLEVDGAGNLYTSDYNTGAIYEIAAGTHAVTTIVPGNLGYRFIGMAGDPEGNVFAADFNNNVVYEIKAGTSGASALIPIASGGPLSNPHAVAVDPAGNVYVGNLTGASNILRYAAGTWAVTALPATGTRSIVLDGSGNIYTVVNESTIASYSRLNPPAIPFPSTVYGATSSAPLVEFENDGNAGLNISAYAATANFGVNGAGNTCAAGTLNAGATCFIGASFAPLAVGNLSGSLSLTDNTLNQANALQSIGLSGTATPGAVTINVTGYTVTYDGAAHTATGTATGANGADLSADLNLSGTTHTNAGTYSGDTWSFHDPNGDYKDISGTVTDVINKANATVTVTPYSLTYDGAAHTATGTVTGVNGAALMGLNLSGTTHTNAATYSTDAWTFTDSTGNYNSATGRVSDLITPAPLTVTANNATTTYGAGLPAFTGSVSGAVNGDTFVESFSTLANASSPAGVYAITPSVTGADLINYSVTDVPGVLTIDPAPLTITANDQTKVLNAPNPALTASYSGFVLGEGPAVLNGTLTCTTTAVLNSPVGGYPITCSGLSSANYTITYVTGKLSVLYLVGACPVPQHQGDNDGDNNDGDHGSGNLILSHVILDPIKADGTSVFDGHGDLPVRFRVCDANGNSIGDPNLIVSFVSLNGPQPTSLGDRDEQGWHFDGDWDQNPGHDQDHANPHPKWTYHLSLRTLANATYNYLITLNDGTTIPFSFTVNQKDHGQGGDDSHQGH